MKLSNTLKGIVKRTKGDLQPWNKKEFRKGHIGKAMHSWGTNWHKFRWDKIAKHAKNKEVFNFFNGSANSASTLNNGTYNPSRRLSEMM